MPIVAETAWVVFWCYVWWLIWREARRWRLSDGQLRAVQHLGEAERTLREGNYRHTLRLCTEQILHPDSQNRDVAYWLRGRAHLHLGNYHRAIDDCNTAIGLNVWLSGAYLVRARAYAALNQPEAALEDYSYVVRLNRVDADASAEYAALLHQLGHTAAAEQETQRTHSLALRNT